MSRKKPFKTNSVILALTILIAQSSLPAGGNAARKKASSTPNVSRVWVADNKDGTYKNPILYADYSDPDAVRVGGDFYMTASSFDAVPGLPILHSKDLVNWTIIGHALQQQPPVEVYSKTQHGNGVWAPAIRYHNGEFYIFYPDPEFGIYMVKAKNPAGPWSTPLLIKQAKGWIDPCPLWDDDGNAYLVNAMAASRSGIKSVLVVSRMNLDGTKLLDDGVLVFDGHEGNPTVEGPKFYKRNGYYYIFAPAGGVEMGWQLALRAKTVYGPYEQKIVLAQGSTQINGPHQGAWVTTQAGQSWFLHFRDMGAYGRVVYLEPMTWVDDWPVMGKHNEPVASWKKPNVGKVWPVTTPADSDEFNGDELGMQWQWQANPKPGWALPAGGLGFLRIFNVAPPPDFKNLWDVPNLLLQKFPGPEFTVTTKVTFTPGAGAEKTGLIIMGMDYAYVSVEKGAEGLLISQAICKDADQHAAERVSASIPVKGNTFYLRAAVSKQAMASFSYSIDGATFTPIGEPFTARQGRWIGAKVGIFATGPGTSREIGYADFDWFRFDSF
jgi:beta-xylosidase